MFKVDVYLDTHTHTPSVMIISGDSYFFLKCLYITIKLNK